MKPDLSKAVVIASRTFMYRGKPAKVDILSPTKQSRHYLCTYRVRGLPRTKSQGSTGENPFQAIYLCYFALWHHLASLGTDIEWSGAADGQLGMPLCVLSHDPNDPNWREVVLKVMGLTKD